MIFFVCPKDSSLAKYGSCSPSIFWTICCFVASLSSSLMAGARAAGDWYVTTTAAGRWSASRSTSVLNYATRAMAVGVSTPTTAMCVSVWPDAAVQRALNFASLVTLRSTSPSVPWPSSSLASYCCFVSTSAVVLWSTKQNRQCNEVQLHLQWWQILHKSVFANDNTLCLIAQL